MTAEVKLAIALSSSRAVIREAIPVWRLRPNSISLHRKLKLDHSQTPREDRFAEPRDDVTDGRGRHDNPDTYRGASQSLAMTAEIPIVMTAGVQPAVTRSLTLHPVRSACALPFVRGYAFGLRSMIEGRMAWQWDVGIRCGIEGGIRAFAHRHHFLIGSGGGAPGCCLWH